MLWLKPLLVGGSVLSLFMLFSPKAKAGSGGTPAPAGRTATVVPNQYGGMMTHKEANLTSPYVAANDAFNGTTVTVLATGIVPADGSGGEWWKIRTPGGSEGYARAVDTAGVHNFQ